MSEAEELTKRLDDKARTIPDSICPFVPDKDLTEAAALIRSQAARIAELEREPPEMETLREVETQWLAEQLSHSIENLGYPVGCGILPRSETMKIAAAKLFDRYAKMISMAKRAAVEEAAVKMMGGE